MPDSVQIYVDPLSSFSDTVSSLYVNLAANSYFNGHTLQAIFLGRFICNALLAVKSFAYK